MKITDKLAKAEREGRPFWSFEFFPPRTAQVGPVAFPLTLLSSLGHDSGPP
jgi:5,10-methylenetetrahydrofolate reductase